MSRSYKKNPIYTDGRTPTPKKSKKYANKKALQKNNTTEILPVTTKIKVNQSAFINKNSKSEIKMDDNKKENEQVQEQEPKQEKEQEQEHQEELEQEHEQMQEEEHENDSEKENENEDNIRNYENFNE